MYHICLRDLTVNLVSRYAYLVFHIALISSLTVEGTDELLLCFHPIALSREALAGGRDETSRLSRVLAASHLLLLFRLLLKARCQACRLSNVLQLFPPRLSDWCCNSRVAITAFIIAIITLIATSIVVLILIASSEGLRTIDQTEAADLTCPCRRFLPEGEVFERVEVVKASEGVHWVL